jgi:methylated-DNA-[protein]-cysteine S-methyltransferase
MPCTVVDSPIGPIGLIASDAGLRAVLFDGRKIRPEGRSTVLAEAAHQFDAYFDGELVTFELPLELHGTEFQRRCWLALSSIPYGQTVSYGEQARRLGLGSDAARAVGAANGRNPLPIVLPCHRVIGANGSLTGFGAGLHVKRFLLEHEGALLPLGQHHVEDARERSALGTIS